MLKEEFIGVSLFTGAGGLDIGMEEAGFCPYFVTDYDSNCISTLQTNQSRRIKIGHREKKFLLEKADIRQEDICNLSGKTIRNRLGKRIDCVYGGPPCQSFSSCGSMGSITDPRGVLIFEFCRFVEEARPRTFVLENVRGLITARCKGGKPGGVLKQLIGRFESIGYGVNVVVINSADYGSFQRRVRCFIVGVDSGTPPICPEPTHSKNVEIGGLLFEESRKKWNTLGDFLKSNTDKNKKNWVRPTSKLESLLEDIPEGSGLKSSGVVETTRPGGHWGYRQGTFIADLELPARTVTGSSSQDWIRLKDNSLRRLTLNEVARLQGFPSLWEFSGPKASQFKQIGNAVPTCLGHVVGSMLVNYLSKYRPGKPTFSINLPKQISAAIEYTIKEEKRNGLSRKQRILVKNKT